MNTPKETAQKLDDTMKALVDESPHPLMGAFVVFDAKGWQMMAFRRYDIEKFKGAVPNGAIVGGIHELVDQALRFMHRHEEFFPSEVLTEYREVQRAKTELLDALKALARKL